ncbi:hypothetical protein SCOR_00210 [Sulfidibacter corallicola]
MFNEMSADSRKRETHHHRGEPGSSVGQNGPTLLVVAVVPTRFRREPTGIVPARNAASRASKPVMPSRIPVKKRVFSTSFFSIIEHGHQHSGKVVNR